MGREKTSADSIIMENVNIREWFTNNSSRHIQAVASREGVKVKTEVMIIVDHKKDSPTAEKILKVTKL